MVICPAGRGNEKEGILAPVLSGIPLAIVNLLVFVTGICIPATASAGNCGASAGAGVDWQECRKRNLMLDGIDLSDSKLASTDFTSTDLRSTVLVGSDLSKSALARAMLDNSQAQGANFEKALGYRTSFVEADLSGANFVKSEMQRADFTGAILTDASFEKSELGRVNFSNADINGTSFRFANLARADFRSAKFETSIDFTGAFLYQTRFEGVDLSKAQGLSQWQVDMTCGDASTKLPDSVTVPADWPCEAE
jgi:uncharacterized protein YjbI with pentapeptide repeats